MRYANPSIKASLDVLLGEYPDLELLLVPLYPHYAMATTTTVVENKRRYKTTLPVSKIILY